MGWSCSRLASMTMDRWTVACIASTGIQNVFVSKSTRYFWEASRKEHRDGSITGQIFRHVDPTHVRPSGSFRINGDGTIRRAPKFLKDAAS